MIATEPKKDRPVLRRLACVLLVLALPACSSTPARTGDISADLARTAKVGQPPVRDYLLAPGDQLEFRVVDAPDMDTVQMVRSDGRITLPMIQDAVASGMTLQQLRATLQQDYIKDGYLKPAAAQGINLIIKKSAANRFFVGGQVKKEGSYQYSHLWPTT